MKCPKCGYHRRTRDNAFVPATECPSCGVIYSKHEIKRPGRPGRSAAPAPPNLRPSPVDADSLKKARDRVEKRLRKRFGSNENDDRHAQTLKLARRFTEEELRKRQAKRREVQLQDDDADPPLELEDVVEVTVAGEKTAETVEEPQLEDLEAVQPADEEFTEETNADADTSEVTGAPDAIEAEKADTNATEKVAETGKMHLAASAPGQAPDSDVRVETVILTSAVPASMAEESAPIFDTTPLDAQDPPSHEKIEPQKTASMEEEQIPVVPEAVAASKASAFQGMYNSRNGQLRMLSAVAWLILGAGITGAILSWTTMGDVEAGMRIPVPDSVNTLSLGLLLGFAYLATGVLGFAFFWVSSTISRQLNDIRRLLMLHPGGLAALDPHEDGTKALQTTIRRRHRHRHR